MQRVRVEAAKRMLEGTPRPIGAIARAVGYEDAVAFRKLFARWTGLTPADHRARYGPRTAPAVVLAARRRQASGATTPAPGHRASSG
jgi:AraC-like DNA-binding protein